MKLPEDLCIVIAIEAAHAAFVRERPCRVERGRGRQRVGVVPFQLRIAPPGAGLEQCATPLARHAVPVFPIVALRPRFGYANSPIAPIIIPIIIAVRAAHFEAFVEGRVVFAHRGVDRSIVDECYPLLHQRRRGVHAAAARAARGAGLKGGGVESVAIIWIVGVVGAIVPNPVVPVDVGASRWAGRRRRRAERRQEGGPHESPLRRVDGHDAPPRKARGAPGIAKIVRNGRIRPLHASKVGVGPHAVLQRDDGLGVAEALGIEELVAPRGRAGRRLGGGGAGGELGGGWAAAAGRRRGRRRAAAGWAAAGRAAARRRRRGRRRRGRRRAAAARAAAARAAGWAAAAKAAAGPEAARAAAWAAEAVETARTRRPSETLRTRRPGRRG